MLEIQNKEKRYENSDRTVTCLLAIRRTLPPEQYHSRSQERYVQTCNTDVAKAHSPDIAKEFNRNRLKSIKSHSRISANKAVGWRKRELCRRIETFINHAKNC